MRLGGVAVLFQAQDASWKSIQGLDNKFGRKKSLVLFFLTLMLVIQKKCYNFQKHVLLPTLLECRTLMHDKQLVISQ
jgi:hypothetical protein